MNGNIPPGMNAETPVRGVLTIGGINALYCEVEDNGWNVILWRPYTGCVVVLQSACGHDQPPNTLRTRNTGRTRQPRSDQKRASTTRTLHQDAASSASAQVLRAMTTQTHHVGKQGTLWRAYANARTGHDGTSIAQGEPREDAVPDGRQLAVPR